MANSNPPFCSGALLRQALDDSLSEQQEDELARHLTQCKTCQQELERLAAEKAEWARVGDILKQEAFASPSGGMASGTASFPNPWHNGVGFRLVPVDEPPVAVADFAVDFLDPSTTADTLGRLGDIDIYEVIGHGGMGIVFRGFQRELNRPVAVKVLAPHLATSGAARKRFAREAQATAVIVHPNVMPILTVHSSSKLPYLVMPYVACESLQQRLDREGPLDAVDVLRIAMQVANGLAAAHAQGLVHRDIKPANVLLEKGVDRTMLTDFGLARAVDDASLTRTGVIAGTPRFMSPEQARGESVDAHSDLFSLGSVMYAMCTGRPPFRAETSYGTLRRITDTEPRPIREINVKIPNWLVATVNKLHAKSPAARFQSATELAKLLEGCLAHLQQPTAVPLPVPARSLARQARSENGSPRFRQFGRLGRIALRPRTLLAGGIVASILVVASIVGPMFRHHAKDDGLKNNGLAPNASASEPMTVPANPLLPAATDSLSATWSDGATEQILAVERDTEQFEVQSARLWEQARPPAASSRPANMNPPPAQEPTQ